MPPRFACETVDGGLVATVLGGGPGGPFSGLGGGGRPRGLAGTGVLPLPPGPFPLSPNAPSSACGFFGGRFDARASTGGPFFGSDGFPAWGEARMPGAFSRRPNRVARIKGRPGPCRRWRAGTTSVKTGVLLSPGPPPPGSPGLWWLSTCDSGFPPGCLFFCQGPPVAGATGKRREFFAGISGGHTPPVTSSGPSSSAGGVALPPPVDHSSLPPALPSDVVGLCRPPVMFGASLPAVPCQQGRHCPLGLRREAFGACRS
ncbi:hypothetical protein GWK47_049322 [Chionoecetes opilio]|uniref:Uncharacterized protein n=1 Tax=Chionoecetes opilio TaxID=41210 RepID=A0A8J5CTE7_CHIOP|nr:hypothetical protein GWK47_049322 [Chionoecetes opilio]